MEHIKKRYFETRDGRCLPFRQLGKNGGFCIVLDDCVDGLECDQNHRYFFPNLADADEVCSTSDSWRFDRPSPEFFDGEGRVERRAKDVLDLANIFRMDSFQVMGDSEISAWLASYFPERIEHSNAYTISK